MPAIPNVKLTTVKTPVLEGQDRILDLGIVKEKLKFRLFAAPNSTAPLRRSAVGIEQNHCHEQRDRCDDTQRQ